MDSFSIIVTGDICDMVQKWCFTLWSQRMLNEGFDSRTVKFFEVLEQQWLCHFILSGFLNNVSTAPVDWYCVKSHRNKPMLGVHVTDVKSIPLVSDFMNWAHKSMGFGQLEASCHQIFACWGWQVYDWHELLVVERWCSKLDCQTFIDAMAFGSSIENSSRQSKNRQSIGQSF